MRCSDHTSTARNGLRPEANANSTSFWRPQPSHPARRSGTAIAQSQGMNRPTLLAALGLALACSANDSSTDPAIPPTVPDGGISPPVADDAGIASPIGEREIDDLLPSVPCTPEAAAQFAEAAEAFAAAMAADNVPGGAIAVLCGGERIFTRTIGNVRTGGEPIDSATRFEIASVTKTLTGLTAARLAEEGMLQLDTPVESLLAGVQVRYLDGTTSPNLEQLLSHTAGYPIDNLPNIQPAETVLMSMISASQHRLMSPPGAVFNYSNYGFALAAAMMEQATSRRFPDLVHQYAIGEASMASASLKADDVLQQGNFAYGHSFESPGVALGPLDSYYHQATEAPMGGGWASIDDLMALSQHLIRREQLNSAAVPIAQARPNTTVEGVGYGLGIGVGTSGTHEVWAHNGSITGFLTDWQVVPELGFAVATLLNSDDVQRREGYDAVRLMESLTEFESRQPSEPSADAMADWAGTYLDPVQLGRVVVAVSGSDATIDWGMGPTPLIAFSSQIADAEYPGPDGFLEVQFWKNDAGQTTYLVTPVGVAIRQ